MIKFGNEFDFDKSQIIGKHVKFTGCTDLQMMYTPNGGVDPRDFCALNTLYEVTDVKMFSFSSLVCFKEFPQQYFNTVCFVPVDFENNLFGENY